MAFEIEAKFKYFSVDITIKVIISLRNLLFKFDYVYAILKFKIFALLKWKIMYNLWATNLENTLFAISSMHWFLDD